MLKLLPALLPWWLAGPGLGLCVAALYGLANRRLGVSGAWLAAVVAPIEGWRGERWRAEFLAAMTGGALAAGVLGSATRLTGYPVLSRTVPAVALLPVLAAGGRALGYGGTLGRGLHVRARAVRLRRRLTGLPRRHRDILRRSGGGHVRRARSDRWCAMNRGMRASTIGVGIAFGFLVTGSGFGNYTTIHQALLLRSWYLFAVFGSAVAVAAAGLALLRRAGTTRYGGPLLLPHRPTRRPQVYGAAIFGVGFGLTGACPGGAVAMVATGGLGGLLVLAGLVSGMWLRGATARPAKVRHPEVVADRLPVQSRVRVRSS